MFLWVQERIVITVEFWFFPLIIFTVIFGGPLLPCRGWGKKYTFLHYIAKMTNPRVKSQAGGQNERSIALELGVVHFCNSNNFGDMIKKKICHLSWTFEFFTISHCNFENMVWKHHIQIQLMQGLRSCGYNGTNIFLGWS